MREVVVEIVGKPNYLRWTLREWVKEIKDIIETEYGVSVNIKTVDADNDMPVLRINNEDVFIGLPSEEGYLIEIIKKKLDELLKRSM